MRDTVSPLRPSFVYFIRQSCIIRHVPSPTEALLTIDTAKVDGLLDRLRSLPVRFTTDGRGTFSRAPALRSEIELTLGQALAGAPIPERAMAIDVPVPDDGSRPAWVPRGSALTLWAAPEGASFHTQRLDAGADILLVGLAGVIECIVIPSARKQRLDVFPDRPDVSALVVEEMTEAEREEFVEYTEGTSSPITLGKNVWVPAGSFVFLEWRERGAILAVRNPRSVAATESAPAPPYTMREARARPPEERWSALDRIRLTPGVPVYAQSAEPRVRMMLLQGPVAVIDESFDESSLRSRILGFLLEREDVLVTVQELGVLATGGELSRELSDLRRDGWITRLAP